MSKNKKNISVFIVLMLAIAGVWLAASKEVREFLRIAFAKPAPAAAPKEEAKTAAPSVKLSDWPEWDNYLAIANPGGGGAQ